MLEETVRLSPEDASVREKLVRAYIENKDLTAARTAVQDLVRLAPASARGHYLSGLIAQSQNRLDDAAADFARAIELEPSAIDALTEPIHIPFVVDERSNEMTLNDAPYYVPANPTKMMDPRPNRPQVILSCDVYVDKQGLMYLTDSNAGLNILQFEGI